MIIYKLHFIFLTLVRHELSQSNWKLKKNSYWLSCCYCTFYKNMTLTENSSTTLLLLTVRNEKIPIWISVHNVQTKLHELLMFRNSIWAHTHTHQEQDNLVRLLLCTLHLCRAPTKLHALVCVCNNLRTAEYICMRFDILGLKQTNEQKSNFHCIGLFYISFYMKTCMHLCVHEGLHPCCTYMWISIKVDCNAVARI